MTVCGVIVGPPQAIFVTIFAECPVEETPVNERCTTCWPVA